MDPNGRKSNPPLPKSGKDWNDQFGESEQVQTDNIWINQNCAHYFERMRATEIQCRSCFWGMYIDPSVETVIEGHLYRHDQKII